MKKIFLAVVLLLLPTLVFAQGVGSTVINQTDIGFGDCPIQVVTTGGTAVNAFPAAKNRHGFQILNFDVTEPLWISFTGTATANTSGSYPIAAATATTFAGAGSYYSPVGFNGNLSVVAATSGHKFSCTVW